MKNQFPFLKSVLFSVCILQSCSSPSAPPEPIGPIPSEQQLAWQELEFYAFIHFNMNTFSNMEWGMGDERPIQFDPSNLDCRQWAKVCKEAGMKGIILTAKHHDGFCLWPSAYTEHSVKNAPWKEGKGDVLKDLSEACKEYDLKFGVYLSPWDRNHPDYGKPEYITYFRNQLRECLTNYGEVFEVWFDGANGGTGYYGGANEERRVDKLTYYDWKNTYSIIRELQPKALIFSDAGPDVRWVGNEHGHAYPTTWSMLMRDSVYAGMPDYHIRWADGQEDGSHWVPAETNVSIRPGWYYHPYEDHKVKSLSRLLDSYYESVGQNATFLLNFPVDKRGLIHEKDVEQVQKLAAQLKKDFAIELAQGQKVTATNERGATFNANKTLDGDQATYWAAEDGLTAASLIIEFEQTTSFNRLVVQEFIALGQRIKEFNIEIKQGDQWEKVAEGTTIGYKRIFRLPEVRTTAVRLNILNARACPTISNIEIYHAPKLLVPPRISRDRAAEVTITLPKEALDIYYTLDGSEPTTNSIKYEGSFSLLKPATVQAIAVDGKQISEISRMDFDVATTKWELLSEDTLASNALDGNPMSWWESKQNELRVDLGEVFPLKGFTYLPMQERWISGFIENYAFYTSIDGENWTETNTGTFANILNSPILQEVRFEETPARYIRLKALKTIDDKAAGFAEFGILSRD